MNTSGVWGKPKAWEPDEEVASGWQHRHQTLPHRRVRDQVVPLVCLLALIVVTVLGSTLALFYWFAAALTSSSLMLCPDPTTCIVKQADAEAACEPGDAGCSVNAEGYDSAPGRGVEIVR
jgi:hypothetical protein